MKKALLTSLFSIIFLGLISCKTTNLDALKNNDPIRVSGTLTLVGNVPFQTYALHIPKLNKKVPLIFKTNKLQTTASKKMGKKIKVKGTIRKYTVTLADNSRDIPKLKIIVDSIVK